MEQSGYYAAIKKNFVFYRDVMLDDGGDPDPVIVKLDLIAAEYGLAGKRRQSQLAQDLRARKARRVDLVFKEGLVERVPVAGRSLGGAMIRAHVRVAGPVPFLLMKANALARRDKPKDAYDIWFLLIHHQAGLEGLTRSVAMHASHGLVHEALGILGKAFAGRHQSRTQVRALSSRANRTAWQRPQKRCPY